MIQSATSAGQPRGDSLFASFRQNREVKIPTSGKGGQKWGTRSGHPKWGNPKRGNPKRGNPKRGNPKWGNRNCLEPAR